MTGNMPFRKLCPPCVQEKRKNDTHRAAKEKEEQDVPTMSVNCMEQRGIDGIPIGWEDGGRNKTIIGIKWILAIVEKKKGPLCRCSVWKRDE